MRKILIPLLIVLISIPGFTQSVAQAALLKLFPVLFSQAKAVPAASWSPEWPAELPPDAFSVSTRSVGSIELSAELMATPSESASKADTAKPGPAAADGETASNEDGSGTLEVTYSVTPGGFEVPVFIAGVAYSLRSVLDASGKIRSFAMTKTGEKAGKESGEGTGKETGDAVGLEGESSKVGLEYDSSGILIRSTIETEGETSFSTFLLLETLVEELVYDAEGLALDRFVYHRGREGVRSLEQVGEDGIPSLLAGFDYDGRGSISSVGTESGTIETLYDALDRPVFIRTTTTEKLASERRLQWDGRGLLVRENRRDQDGKTREFRYEYVFDRYGNWTERRSLVYAERMGVFIPQSGPKVTRKIIYR